MAPRRYQLQLQWQRGKDAHGADGDGGGGGEPVGAEDYGFAEAHHVLLPRYIWQRAGIQLFGAEKEEAEGDILVG